eukprot:SAG22_NODE_575_length_8991_cov_12.134859_4_plen_194_part_00
MQLRLELAGAPLQILHKVNSWVPPPPPDAVAGGGAEECLEELWNVQHSIARLQDGLHGLEDEVAVVAMAGLTGGGGGGGGRWTATSLRRRSGRLTITWRSWSAAWGTSRPVRSRTRILLGHQLLCLPSNCCPCSACLVLGHPELAGTEPRWAKQEQELEAVEDEVSCLLPPPAPYSSCSCSCRRPPPQHCCRD